jgi:hypothetical protein
MIDAEKKARVFRRAEIVLALISALSQRAYRADTDDGYVQELLDDIPSTEKESYLAMSGAIDKFIRAGLA